MEGDGIGGSVNLVTKTATDTPMIEITGLGGYTPIQDGRGNASETATFGRRFGPGQEIRCDRGSGPMTGKAAASTTSSRSRTKIMARHGSMARASGSTGTSARVTVLRGAPTTASATDRTSTRAFSIRISRTMVTALLTNCRTTRRGVSVLAPQNQGGVPSYDGELRNPDIQVGSLILGGTHVFDTTWYTWEANIGRSSYGNSPYFGRILQLNACFEQLRIQPDGNYRQVPPAIQSGLFYGDSRIRPTSPSMTSPATWAKLCS